MAKGSGKTRSKRAPRKGRRFAKPARAAPNTAKVVEFFEAISIEANTAYDFVVQGIVPTTGGGKATRASMVAPAYGLYRIADVQFKLTPRFDTYSSGLNPGGDAPVEVPNLYWKVNRYGDAPVGFVRDDLLSLGCKPHRLDDNIVTIQYKPNILLADAGAPAAALAGGSGQVKMTPWLSTDRQAADNNFALSTTTHYGHMLFIECAAGGDGTPIVCDMTARVVYEFKNPRMLEDESVSSARRLTKHVRVSPGNPTLIQAQGVRPDGWNLQNTAPV